MKKRVERLRGMHDMLPDEYQHQRRVIDSLSTFLSQAGYAMVDSPIKFFARRIQANEMNIEAG